MNFFTMDGDWKFATQLWFFFVITGPITFAGLLLFLFEMNVVGWVKETFTEPVKKHFRERQMRKAASGNKALLRSIVPLHPQNKIVISSGDRTVLRKDGDSPPPV